MAEYSSEEPRDTPLLPDEHPEKHEHSDVPFRPLVIFGIVFGILAIVTHTGMWGLMRVFQDEQDRFDVKRTALPDAQMQPPKIPLQGIHGLHANTPKQDREAMEKRDRNLTRTYSQVRPDGTARIPIDRAIDIAIDNQIFHSRSAEGGANAQP